MLKIEFVGMNEEDKMMEKIKIKKALTTGEAAKMLSVSQQTVIRLCNRGWLGSFKVLGGSGHRRIPVEALADYARENNIPLDLKEVATEERERKPIQILIIDKEGGTTSAIATVLEESGCEIRRVEKLFSAGVVAGRSSQDIILVGSAFAENLAGILGAFPGETLKVIQKTKGGCVQEPLIDNYLKLALERRQQKKDLGREYPQIIFCI